MESKRGSAAEMARQWSSCSDNCLKALGYLPAEQPELTLPRAKLTSLALECRLKAYLCATRGGAPGTSDLARLVTLALHCGLALTPEQFQVIVAVDRPSGSAQGSAGVPALAPVEQLCESIEHQTERAT